MTTKDNPAELTPDDLMVSHAQQVAAYAVHVYTASGIVFILLATKELFAASPNPAVCFFWLLIAVLIDATDGPLARRFHVKTRARHISGRTIDDIVDYLGFTFVPLLLVWRMDWLPGDQEWSWLWIVPALMTSLFGFAHVTAKHEDEGFFSGFPSYWNVFAFYAGIWFTRDGPWPVAIVLQVLAVATVLPVRFLYPNMAPRPWRTILLIGAGIWSMLMFAMLWDYPRPAASVYGLSLVYPLFYTVLSVRLDWTSRQQRAR